MNFGFRICCRPLADASHRHLRAAHGLLLRIRLDPLPQPPAGSDFGFATHRAGLFNAKTQRRNGAKSTQSSLTQRRDAETQRRRGDLTGFLRVARFRPSDGRKPLGRDTAPNTSVHLGVPAQRLALSKRKPRHFSFLFSSDGVHASPTPYVGEERQNRRASGTSAGEKAGCDERSRSEQTDFSPATGDPIACRSAIKKRNLFPNSAFAPLRLCVFASLRSFLGEWEALRLRGSAPLRFFLCVSVPLWFFDLRIPRSA